MIDNAKWNIYKLRRHTKQKIKISLNAKEEKLILEALNEKRSNQIKENRPIEPVNDLIFKLIKKDYILKG